MPEGLPASERVEILTKRISRLRKPRRHDDVLQRADDLRDALAALAQAQAEAAPCSM